MSPSARKVWIEIQFDSEIDVEVLGHLPRGRCGLKFTGFIKAIYNKKSPSARKVWIEMGRHLKCIMGNSRSPSARKVWIEILYLCSVVLSVNSHLPRGRCGLKSCSLTWYCSVVRSPSARKVWIEIITHGKHFQCHHVTFREEGVD